MTRHPRFCSWQWVSLTPSGVSNLRLSGFLPQPWTSPWASVSSLLWQVDLGEGQINDGLAPAPAQHTALTEALTSAMVTFSSAVRKSRMILRGSSGGARSKGRHHLRSPRLV